MHLGITMKSVIRFVYIKISLPSNDERLWIVICSEFERITKLKVMSGTKDEIIILGLILLPKEELTYKKKKVFIDQSCASLCVIWFDSHVLYPSPM